MSKHIKLSRHYETMRNSVRGLKFKNGKVRYCIAIKEIGFELGERDAGDLIAVLEELRGAQLDE